MRFGTWNVRNNLNKSKFYSGRNEQQIEVSEFHRNNKQKLWLCDLEHLLFFVFITCQHKSTKNATIKLFY